MLNAGKEESCLKLKENIFNTDPYKSQYFNEETKNWDQITILPTRMVGEGSFSIAFEAIVLFGDTEKTYIVKKRKINQTAQFNTSPKPLDESFEEVKRLAHDRLVSLTSQEINNYKQAKKAGLKVFPECFYIFGKNGPEILMTSGFSQECVCLGDKNAESHLAFFNQENIHEIPNLELLVDEMIEQARLGYEAGSYIGVDAYFFLVKSGEDRKVDFIVGDVSSLEFDSFYANKTPTYTSNLESVRRALIHFIEKNVREPHRQDYCSFVNEKIEKAKMEHGNGLKLLTKKIFNNIQKFFLGSK